MQLTKKSRTTELSPLLTSVCLFSIALTVAVFCLRIYYSVSFSQTYHFLTSGSEEESFYAAWKYVHGLPVFVDFHKSPFAASYFNWAFYVGYGSVIKLVLGVLQLGDEWIPTIGRIITLAGCAAGFLVARKIARRLIRPHNLSLLQTALLLFFFAGYLMGFWAITVRPDVWALTFELTGFYFFLRSLDSGKRSGLLAAGLFFYLSWSFKQNFVGLFGGCLAYLLLRKKFSDAVGFFLPFAAAAALTYFAGSPDYRYLLFKSQLRMKITPSIGFANLKLALSKSLPMVLLTVGLAAVVWRQHSYRAAWQKIRQDSRLQLLVLCFGISLLLFLFMSMKEGASDNYFFTPFVTLTFLLGYVSIRLRGSKPYQQALLWVFVPACLLNAGEGALIMTGKFGQINRRPYSKQYETVKRILDTLPKPVLFEKDNIANLPWINSSPQNFILATTYYYKDAYGDAFEYGGIEGLMQKGYFSAVVDEGYPVFDLKERYRLSDSVSENNHRFYIWRKK